MSYAKEYSRFYDPATQEAVELVLGLNGRPRRVNKKDALARGLKRSVTSYLKFLNKPALNAWLLNKMMLAALTATRLPDESDEMFIRRIQADADKESEDAAGEGTAIHKAIEKYILGELYDQQYKTHVEALETTLRLHGIELKDGDPEKVFVCKTHGCRPDWVSRKQQIVIDYKTRDFISGKGNKFYDDYLLQLCGNADAVFPVSQPRLINALIGRKDGKVLIHEWSAEDFLRGHEGWLHLVGYVQAIEGV